VRQVLVRSDQRPSATSALADAIDSARRLGVAVQRYLDAHIPHATGTAGAADTGEIGGPLPWLPPPPDPDNGELAEYLQWRADLVHALAGTITDADLPATEWARQLRSADPDLARRLAVWRAATGITEHPQPLGPDAGPTPAGRADLASQLRPHIGADLPAPAGAGRPVSPTGAARDRDARHARVHAPMPEHDTRLARAHHRDREHGPGIRR
jgi:hypothetical protein